MPFDTVVPEDEGRRRCNDTWFFLDAYSSGTPVRCAPQGGRLQCASQLRSRGHCQWGALRERPKQYQPLHGVLTANYVVEAPCKGWTANDGSDPCAELRCYYPDSADFCSPISLLPPLEVHNGALLTIYGHDDDIATTFEASTESDRWYENQAILELGAMALAMAVMCLCLCACGIKLHLARRSLRLLRKRERASQGYALAHLRASSADEEPAVSTTSAHDDGAEARAPMTSPEETSGSTASILPVWMPSLLHQPELPPWDIMYVEGAEDQNNGSRERL